MSTFACIAGLALIVLSLSYLVSALPAVSVKIPVITGVDPCSRVLSKLFVDIEVKVNALLGCGTIQELTVVGNAMVASFTSCFDDLLKVGAGVAVSVDSQTNIVACIAALFSLLVQACATVSLKFGLAIVLNLLAEIDIALKCAAYLGI